MAPSTMPAYYLMIIGASLTITSSISVYISRVDSGTSGSYVFVIPLLLGIAIVYLGQQFYRKPAVQFERAVEIAAVSLVALFFLRPILFITGPSISFAGAMLGALLTRESKPTTTQSA